MGGEPLVSHKSKAVEAHTFNPSTREPEMGSDLAGRREEYKAGGDRSSGFSLRICRDRVPAGLKIL